MNSYLSHFLNIPHYDFISLIFTDTSNDTVKELFSGKPVSSLTEPKEMSDPSLTKLQEMMIFLKYAYDIDVIKDVNRLLKKKTCQNNLMSYFTEMIKYLNQKIGFNCNDDFGNIEEFFVFDNLSLTSTLDYLATVLCQCAFECISLKDEKNKGINKVTSIVDQYSFLQKSIEEDSNINKTISKQSLEGHLRNEYHNNFVSLILAPDDNTLTERRNAFMSPQATSEKRKYLNYTYSIALSEVSIASIICGSKSVFREKNLENDTWNYSNVKLNTFYTNYYYILNNTLEQNNYTSAYLNKHSESKWRYNNLSRYSNLMKHCAIYLSERIYAFSTIKRIDDLIQNDWMSISTLKYILNAYETVYRLPNVIQRNKLSDNIAEYFFKLYECDKLTQNEMRAFNQKLIQKTDWQTKVFYPIVMLYSVVLMAGYFIKYKINENKCEYILSLFNENICMFDEKENLSDTINRKYDYTNSLATSFYENLITSYLNCTSFENTFCKNVLNQPPFTKSALKAFIRQH